MRLVYILFVQLLSTTTHCTHKQWGGFQMIINQAGINTATEFLQDHFAYVLRRQDFKEHRILKNTIVNNIHLMKTNGMYTELTIEENNTLRLNSGFADFFVQANVTLIRTKSVLQSPNTVVNFKNTGISTYILIGQGEDGKDVNLVDCFINMDSLELVRSSPETRQLLESFVVIAQQQIQYMASSFCTELENRTRTRYKDLLDFEGDFIVRGDGPIQLTMYYRFNNITTSHGKVIIKTAVSFIETGLPDYGSRDVEFPDPQELGYDNTKEVEMWYNSDFMAILIMKALEVEKIIPKSLSVFETDRHDFKIITNQEADTSVETTKYGVALHISSVMTILQARRGANEYCVDLTVDMTGILPFRIQINDTRTEYHPDPDRFYMNMTVSKEDVAYTDCASINPRKYPAKFEKKVLHQFLKDFERNYNHRFVFAKLPRDKYIGNKNTSIEFLKDCAVITADLARAPDMTQEGTIESVHKLYHHRIIQYTYSDKSSETYIDNKPRPSGSGTNDSVLSLSSSCVILMGLVCVLLIM